MLIKFKAIFFNKRFLAIQGFIYSLGFFAYAIYIYTQKGFWRAILYGFGCLYCLTGGIMFLKWYKKKRGNTS